jgi:hypothetical protein
MASYYAASNVTYGDGDGTIGSPWNLHEAFGNGSQGPGDTLYLRGGTYYGKFRCNLAGGTVRSYPGEWAVINGGFSTTLVGAVDADDTTFTFASIAYMNPAIQYMTIDNENIRFVPSGSTTVTGVERGISFESAGDGATPHDNGATVWAGGEQLVINGGGDTTFEFLEIMNSSVHRDELINFATNSRGTGIAILGAVDGTVIRMCVIHDNRSAIFTGSSSSNTRIYGNIIYNNGILPEDRDPAGIGTYAENSSGFSQIHKNIYLNNVQGINGFGVSGPYVGGDIKFNIFGNNGVFYDALGDPGHRNANCAVGPNDSASPTAVVEDNYAFQPDGSFGEGNFKMGQSAGITTLTFNRNIAVGGQDCFKFVALGALNGSDNEAYSVDPFDNTQAFVYPSTVSGGNFDNNTYHDPHEYAFGNQNVGRSDFAAWKGWTVFDDNSTATTDPMPDTVKVVPIDEETGRAHVAIFTRSGNPTIDVNLATSGLVDGQSFDVINAFDYNGTPVESGLVYDSGDTTITLTLADMESVVDPVGLGFSPDTTAPHFAVLVIDPTSEVVPNLVIASGARFNSGVRFG